jgi:hypothetical protein
MPPSASRFAEPRIGARGRRSGRRHGPASRRNSVRTAAAEQALLRVAPSITQNNGPTGNSARAASQGAAAPSPTRPCRPRGDATLAAAHQDRAAPLVEVALGEREPLLNAQPGAPQHDDHRSQAPAVGIVTGVAHDRHDLIDGGRVGPIPQYLVARRAPGVVAGHRRRRTPAPGRVRTSVRTRSQRSSVISRMNRTRSKSALAAASSFANS